LVLTEMLNGVGMLHRALCGATSSIGPQAQERAHWQERGKAFFQ
jgi:hypothetical protein